MSRLIEKLNEYGADTSGAMERFLDDEELYESCLETFYQEPAFHELGRAISSKNYEEAFNHSHTLKGVTGNMGLTPLFNVIVILVESLRNNDYSDIENQYAQVMDEFNKSKTFFLG